MFKHATIGRNSRAQQTLRKQWNEHNSRTSADGFDEPDHGHSGDANEDLNNNNASIFSNNWLSNTRVALSCSSSPSPSLVTTPTGFLSSAPSSVFNSPSKSNSSIISATATASATIPTSTIHRSTSESMIRIFAQTLSQEVEYVTLHVNAQTKSQQIIKSLLRKFRLKHRDPNLFYLTLERWIRKDGIKFKSVMLLGDEACPLQLQQCCSNPPHNDIKFTLQMRAGALMKIFCSDVCPDTKYKCLSLSTNTTVEEAIGLMLHCLSLTIDCDTKQTSNNEPPRPNICSSQVSESATATMTTTSTINHHRQASSPSSTGSSSSSASSTYSSSGIESDMTNQNTRTINNQLTSQNCHRLNANSRTSSVTSISSASNLSNTSSSQSFSDHYCLVIECENSNYKRVLEHDDCLVEIYQGLLDEAREQPIHQSPPAKDVNNKVSKISSSSSMHESIKQQQQQPDQWFVIKLKRRDDLIQPSIKFANPRQNMPLPPIPPSLAQFSNANDLQFFVSTTQIEVNHHPGRSTSSLAASAFINKRNNIATSSTRTAPATTTGVTSKPPTGQSASANSIATACSRPIVNCHQKQMSAIISNGCEKMPPPPETLIWLPPIKPRRRNLSNASSTFGRPLQINPNRRRYDPAQLAEDLNQLNLSTIVSGACPKLEECDSHESAARPTDSIDRDMSLNLDQIEKTMAHPVVGQVSD